MIFYSFVYYCGAKLGLNALASQRIYGTAGRSTLGVLDCPLSGPVGELDILNRWRTREKAEQRLPQMRSG
jgi:hypothetical protein